MAVLLSGCIFQKAPPIIMDSKSEVIALEVPKMPLRDAETVFLWPDDKDIKLELDFKPYDTRGNLIIPLIKLQMQA